MGSQGSGDRHLDAQVRRPRGAKPCSALKAVYVSMASDRWEKNLVEMARQDEDLKERLWEVRDLLQ